MYDTGEEIVGLKLAKRMSNKQLDAFERFFEARDDEGAFKWLERNFPDYREIVDETFDELDEALREAAKDATRQPNEREPTSRRESES
jgi:succinate dehydrogenase flavin-adding protein (antitoxin of CptAB toxin-antitoxin module)